MVRLTQAPHLERGDLLVEALADLDRFGRKYGHLRELAEVFEAIGKLRARLAPD